MKYSSLILLPLFLISACTQVPVAPQVNRPVYVPTLPQQETSLKHITVQVGKTKKIDIKNAIGSPDRLIVSDGKETWYYSGKKLLLKVTVADSDGTTIDYLMPETFYPEFNSSGVMTGVYVGK